MASSSGYQGNVVGRSREWVALFSGDESTAVIIRLRLEEAGIASKLDQPIIGTSHRLFSIAVAASQRVDARRIVAEVLPPHAAAKASHDRSETTRLLCGTALLNRRYRRQVLDSFDDTTRAVPPELGVDLRLVAGVARALERRERNFEVGFAVAWLVSLLVAWIIAFTSPILLPLVALAASLWASIALFNKVYVERWALPQCFTRTNFNAESVRARFGAPSEEDPRLPRADQNVVVYSGFTPFVGAGVEIGGWSYVVDTNKVQPESGAAATSPFAATDIYDAVLAEITRLDLPQVEIRDFVFLSGRDIRDDRKILPDIHARPVQVVERAYLDRVRAASGDHHARWYPWIRIYDWDNEVAVSQFLRFHKRGKHLFVELKRYVLPPLHAGFRGVDAVAPIRFLKILGLALGALLVGWAMLPLAPLMLLARASGALQRLMERGRRLRSIDDNPAFDYGTTGSIRQAGSNGYYSHYFQQADATMINQMLEGQILNTIVDFLDEHNVDTSDIQERRTTILNSGIIVHGGNVNAQALAVGQHASANQTTPKKTTFAGLKRALTPPGAGA